MPGLHAVAAPSSLATIVACLAHLQMAQPYKDDPPTPESLEGDAAHWVNVQLVVHKSMPAVGLLTPQGLPVDADMQDGATLWHSIVGDYGHSEMPVVIQRLHPTLCWGTPDWWRYDPIEGVLRVADYKYGHLFVDAFEFWQGIAYVAGLLEMLGLPADTRVEFIIVQPRNYHPLGPVRRWMTTAAALQPYFERTAAAIARALAPHPEATVGPHCDFCPGRHECATLQHASMAATAYTNTMDRVNLPPSAVAVELRILEAAAQLIEARLTGLQQQAMSLIKSGAPVPGYQIEHPAGNLKWNKPVGEVLAIGELMGITVGKPVDTMTPTQALKAGIPASIVDIYATRPPGKAKLVPVSNVQTRKIFGATAT